MAKSLNSMFSFLNIFGKTKKRSMRKSRSMRKTYKAKKTRRFRKNMRGG
jgi:hypothetical protein